MKINRQHCITLLKVEATLQFAHCFEMALILKQKTKMSGRRRTMHPEPSWALSSKPL